MENKCKGVVRMMDTTFKLGCKTVESMKGGMNVIRFSGSRIFRMGELKR